MPADYSSTAKALALPISPVASPSLERQQTPRPSWSQRLSSSTHRSPYSLNARRRLTYKDQIIHSAQKVQRKILKTYKRLTPLQRLGVVIIMILNVVFITLFLKYNERIFGALTPYAKKWHDIRGGWTILWALTFISAFPPLIGYSTTVTIAGFVYGFPNGWFIVASATVAGSLASFLASRTVLSKYVQRLVGKDKRFNALALTLKHDGLKILCMIRFCPLPYSLSNAAMSTFPTVQPLSFALATALASPKLLIQVFIGSRLASIAESGGKMDTSTKIINYASIIIGAVLGAAVGWIIYQRTIARAKELEIEELEAAGEEGRVVGVLGRERAYSDLDVDGAGAGQDEGALMVDDDDISLWDNDGAADAAVYRDDFTDDELDGDVFASGDGSDEEAGIGSIGKGRGKI